LAIKKYFLQQFFSKSLGQNSGLLLKSLIYKARILYSGASFVVFEFIIFFAICYLTLIYEKVDPIYWGYLSFWSSILIYCQYYIIIDDAFSVGWFHLMCSLIRGRVRLLNERIINDLEKLDHGEICPFERVILVKYIIVEQNDICSQLARINRFIKTPYAIALLFIFPISLSLLHQVLFEQLDIIWRIFFTLGVLFTWAFIFINLSDAAKVCKEIHSTRKKLCFLQWSLKGGIFAARTKIKLLAAFERVSHQEAVGFTVKNLYVITMAFFYRVSQINYCINNSILNK